MKENLDGRFCLSCQKTVYDFTGKTNEEILSVISGATSGSVCGRFYQDQLDQPKDLELSLPVGVFYQTKIPSQIAKWALFLTFATTLFSCTTPRGESARIKKVKLVDSLQIPHEDEPQVLTGVTVAVDPKTIEERVDTVEIREPEQFEQPLTGKVAPPRKPACDTKPVDSTKVKQPRVMGEVAPPHDRGPVVQGGIMPPPITEVVPDGN
ncbi:MAG: hypothetical protein C4K58_02085 [Flavobacteriaceae bacterium]|nr:MAG: hypothetical protein C4K58_02085 [Flavobacteriaceae bacterium]